MTARLPLLALIALTVSSQPDPAEAEIRATRNASNQALLRRDAKAFAASLDDDFAMTRGNGVHISSRQAYIDLFTHDFADPAAIRYQRIPDKVELSAAAPLAAEHGHWVGTRPNGTQAYAGTYLAMWRRGPDGWKIRSELFVILSCADGPACAGYRKP